MRIEEDLKLGFKDVLIRPKRSTLKSRSDVELERQFTFKHSGQSWSGVPIIAANMDTVGTFSMASALASFDILTAVHKHYSVEEWQAFINNSSADVLKHVMVSTGTSDADFEKTKQILDLNPALNFVCIDVANGYSEHFVQFVAKAREACPSLSFRPLTRPLFLTSEAPASWQQPQIGPPDGSSHPAASREWTPPAGDIPPPKFPGIAPKSGCHPCRT